MPYFHLKMSLAKPQTKTPARKCSRTQMLCFSRHSLPWGMSSMLKLVSPAAVYSKPSGIGSRQGLHDMKDFLVHVTWFGDNGGSCGSTN